MLPAMWSSSWSLTQAIMALAFVTIVTYGYNAQSRWKLRSIPGPTPAWLVGNLRELRARNGIHLTLESWYQQYGPIYKFFLGRAPIVVVTEPDLLKQIFTKSFMKFHDRPELQMRVNEGNELTAQGMLSARVDFRAQQDASSALVQHSLNVFRPASGTAFTLVRSLLVCFPFLISAVAQVLAYTQLARVTHIAGARGYLKGASEALLKNARANSSKAGSTAALAPDTDIGIGARGLLDRWTESPAHKTFAQAYAEGRRDYEREVPGNQSLLHNLMAAKQKHNGQPLTDTQISAQSFTFILAGYETTSMALTYALYELSRSPVMQQRLVDEVDQFGRGKEPAFADMAQFPFADAVLKEGMRLHPPVTPLIGLTREATEDVVLGTHQIPAGTRIWINVLSLHLDDKYFPNAKEFMPDRFLEPDSKPSHHPYAYIPFGAGPRKCIGYKFATMEGVLALVRLYQRFTFTLNDQKHGGKPLEHESLITLMPKGGVWLNVHSRS
ncbi:MAG: cytochrome P450 [Trebouxia sp. A1-2]|nr:MAG: cytochrome P450 [Trebouxia sp. A1-2]